MLRRIRGKSESVVVCAAANDTGEDKASRQACGVSKQSWPAAKNKGGHGFNASSVVDFVQEHVRNVSLPHHALLLTCFFYTGAQASGNSSCIL